MSWLSSAGPQHLQPSLCSLSLAVVLTTGCREPAPTEPPAGNPPVVVTTTANLGLPLLPANGRIAFGRSSQDTDPATVDDTELFSVNPDGTGLTQLTDNTLDERHPTWSPDGTKLAYVVAGNESAEIFVMNADGTGVTNLTNDPALDFDPAWSADGTRIAFASTRHGGPSSIWLMRADGTGALRITAPSAGDVEPAWSPDGAKIAFASIRDGSSEVYVMNADGTGIAKLTSMSGEAGNPQWSPYGAQIVFQAGVLQGTGEMSPAFLDEIFRINVDGTGLVNLTSEVLPGTTARHFGPVWSPDGTTILYASSRSGQPTGLFLMNPDGTDKRPLSAPEGDDMPSWQPTLLPIPWDFGGFLAPIDKEPVVNVTKAGRAIPLRFSLGGDKGMDVFLTGYPKFVTEDCDSGEAEDVIETTAEGPAGLTYDRGADRYLYVWKTTTQQGGRCGRFVLGLRDRSNQSATFRFTR